MSLPYFEENGWKPTILAGRAEDAGTGRDQLLEHTIPANVPVHRVKAWSERRCRRFGFGHFGYRCVFPIYRAGCELLRHQRFDLVYFSTTMFNVMPLGVRWKRRFGVPFVIDLQDPWYAGPRCIYSADNAPGGLLKYRLAQALARFLEPKTIRQASAIISVSQGYIDTLCVRYGETIRRKSHVIPFGAPERDYQLLPGFQVKQSIFNPGDGLIHWVSVGAVVSIWKPILARLFRALAKLRTADPKRWNRVRWHFVGTSYASGDRTKRTVMPVAEEEGVADMLTEETNRVPYFEALQVMSDSAGILVVGSPDANYTASRLFAVLLARRPFRAFFHQASLVAEILRELHPESLIPFPELSESEERVTVGLEGLLASCESNRIPSVKLEAFSAERLTATQCRVFDEAVKS